MTTKDINILIDRYLAGETTPEEERRLALEVAQEGAPEEWKAIAVMLGDLTVGEAMYDEIMQSRKAKAVEHDRRRKGMWTGWSVAASIVVAVMVTGVLLFSGHGAQDDSQLVAQVDTLRTDTATEKSDVQSKPVRNESEAEKTVKDIRRITLQRKYVAQATEAETTVTDECPDYGDDYAEVDEPMMILGIDLDEFRNRVENLNEAVAVVNDAFEDE